MQSLRESLRAARLPCSRSTSARAARGARLREKMALRFPILLDRDMTATRAWSARVLPASYVIAPDGKVAYSYLGAIDWNSPQVKGGSSA